METVGDLRRKYEDDEYIGTVEERYIDAVRLRRAGLTFREIGLIIGPIGPSRAAELYRKGERILAGMKVTSRRA